MKSLITFKAILICFLVFNFSTTAQNLEAQIDEIVTDMYAPDDTGVSILVSKKGKTIYHKAFGKANLELDVPKNNYSTSFTKSYIWYKKLYRHG